MKALHLKPRKRVRNIIMFPRDMYSLEVEITSQSTEGKVPNQLHNPGNFGLSRINYLYHT